MRVNKFCASLLVLVLLLSVGCATKPPPSPRTNYEIVAANPSYASVTKLPYREADAKISYGDGPHQYGLFWAPQNASRDTLIVFIHGGCWLSAFDIQHTFATSTALSDAGYAVWNIEYRRSGDTGGGWPVTYEDIKAGISAIKQLKSYQINPKHLVISGHSAGGHLALLSGSDINSILPTTQAKIHVAGLAAITDITSYASGTGSCQKAAVTFMKAAVTDDPEIYAQANPIQKSTLVATHLFQGDADTIVPVDQATAMKTKHKVQLNLVPGAGHFDWVHPGTPAFRKFLNYLDSID